jgi:hypothetical protein
MSGIWISKEEVPRIKKKLEDFVEEDALYEGHKIEELYIDRWSGDLEGFIGIGDIGVAIHIPFEEWVAQFIHFGSFEDLPVIFKRKQQELLKACESAETLNQHLSSTQREKTEE